MRTRTIAVMIVAMLVLSTGAAAVAHDGKGKGKGPGGVTALTLYATETAATFITAGGDVIAPDDETMPTAGARFLAVDTLYGDAARTDQVGRNDIECTLTEVTGTSEADASASLLCNGVVTLDGQGTLAWQAAVTFAGMEGEVDPSQPFATVALTGGTGAFTRAGGEVVLFDESTSEDVSLTRYEVSLLRFRTSR
jgi:hypothetical protein